MKVVKTSETHPLPLASIKPSTKKGCILFTMCPGKVQPSAVTGPWDRDLIIDMNALAAAGTSTLLTLMDDAELAACNLTGEEFGQACTDRNIHWLQSPIVDFQAPDEDWERRWVTVGADLRAQLHKDETIAIHCRGGRGRAGMIAARLLVELGTSPKSAITMVRAQRPEAIETSIQEEHVLGCTKVVTS